MKPTEKERTLARLEKNKWIVGNCWRWIGTCATNGGHAVISFRNKPTKVSRLIMWITQDFDISSKLYVLHKTVDGTCKFTDCWNPDHLYVGTHRQNMDDKRKEFRLKQNKTSQKHNSTV